MHFLFFSLLAWKVCPFCYCTVHNTELLSKYEGKVNLRVHAG
jgi:hypothetical protein